MLLTLACRVNPWLNLLQELCVWTRVPAGRTDQILCYRRVSSIMLSDQIFRLSAVWGKLCWPQSVQTPADAETRICDFSLENEWRILCNVQGTTGETFLWQSKVRLCLWAASAGWTQHEGTGTEEFLSADETSEFTVCSWKHEWEFFFPLRLKKGERPRLLLNLSCVQCLTVMLDSWCFQDHTGLQSELRKRLRAEPTFV